MGRCYDFGVSIDASSERAMIVAPEGGQCICPSSGATCSGRFSGCTDILSQPGRVPANAPGWSLDQTPVAVSAAQPLAHPSAHPLAHPLAHPSALAATQPAPIPPVQLPVGPELVLPEPVSPAPSQSTVTPAVQLPTAEAQQDRANAQQNRVETGKNAEAIAALHTTIEELRAELIESRQLHNDEIASVIDLDDAISLLRQTIVSSHLNAAQNVDELRSKVGAVGREVSALESIPEQITNLEKVVSDGHLRPSPIRPELELVSDRLGRMHTSLEQLARGIVEVRNVGSATATTSDMATLRSMVDTSNEMLAAFRGEMVKLAKQQSRETHDLRKQVTDLRTQLTAQRNSDSTGTTISTELAELRREMSRLRPEGADIVTATELAETINTLRAAGAEQISAAHLIHTFQLEMRGLRAELANATKLTTGPVQPNQPGRVNA